MNRLTYEYVKVTEFWFCRLEPNDINISQNYYLKEVVLQM